MDLEDVNEMLKTEESFNIRILQNGKHEIGSLRINPKEFYSSLEELIFSEEVKLFNYETDFLQALKVLEKTEFNDFELAFLKEGLSEEIKRNPDLVNRILANSSYSSEKYLRNRLLRRFHQHFVSTYFNLFENLLNKMLVTIAEISGVVAENDVREELGMPLLLAKKNG
jgi:hypothetical protein